MIPYSFKYVYMYMAYENTSGEVLKYIIKYLWKPGIRSEHFEFKNVFIKLLHDIVYTCKTMFFQL